MATSIILKTMTDEWREFFKYARKQHWKKYFPDEGNETCAYNSEWGDSHIVQAAIRRQRGKSEKWVPETHRKIFSQILGKDNFVANIVYVTCSYAYGGVWFYDENEIYENGGRKQKQRGVNEYYILDLKKCHKIMNLWDICSKCKYRVKYAIARNQYECMLKDDHYANVKTWKDLPDWCLWKFQNPDGSVIEGREKEFEEYITKTKAKADFIDVEDWSL